MSAATIRVRIDDYDCAYHLYQTAAPASYDGMGTIVVETDGDTRLVLVAAYNLEWQLGRYGSGAYPTSESDLIGPSELRDLLVSRLSEGGAK